MRVVEAGLHSGCEISRLEVVTLVQIGRDGDHLSVRVWGKREGGRAGPHFWGLRGGRRLVKMRRISQAEEDEHLSM